jgi:hypothetical protein
MASFIFKKTISDGDYLNGLCPELTNKYHPEGWYVAQGQIDYWDRLHFYCPFLARPVS